MKKTLILIVSVIVVVAGYLIWKNLLYKTSEEKAIDAVEKTMGSAAAGTLPELQTKTNPLENLPETNPLKKTNPFKDLKTNPF